jgi:hypothetical protein
MFARAFGFPNTITNFDYRALTSISKKIKNCCKELSKCTPPKELLIKMEELILQEISKADLSNEEKEMKFGLDFIRLLLGHEEFLQDHYKYLKPLKQFIKLLEEN